jgi:hypothetical protein
MYETSPKMLLQETFEVLTPKFRSCQQRLTVTRSLRVALNARGDICGRRSLQVRVRDISTTGLFLECKLHPNPGEQVHVRFCLPQQNGTASKTRSIEVLGEVRRNQLAGGSGFGVRFVRLSHEDQTLIHSFLGRLG